MKRHARKVTADLAVIGTGLAGFAASLFARDRGLSVVQIGHTGALSYTTGYLDLFGALDGKVIDDPWSGLDALHRVTPTPPLARLSRDEIDTALSRFIDCLGEMGLHYTAPGPGNLTALLPGGLTKPTFSIPETMRPGIEAMQAGRPALIVDFDGLQGFSATEFRINMAEAWPGLRSERLTFPGIDARPVFPEVMARALETIRNTEVSWPT